MRLLAAVLAMLSFGAPTHAVAAATTSDAEALAQKYAPIIVTKNQEAPCDENGEAYRPVPVDVLLNRDDVVVRNEDGSVAITGPSAADLYNAGADTNIDMPFDALDPGCDFERWFKEISAGQPTTVYAHVVVDPDHPGKVAL